MSAPRCKMCQTQARQQAGELHGRASRVGASCPASAVAAWACSRLRCSPSSMHAGQDCCLFEAPHPIPACPPPAVARLEQQALKSSIDPLYQQVKSYICCRVSNGVYDIWVAWTVAGVLGFLLAMMCSGRIAHHTLSMRKYQVGGWAGGRVGVVATGAVGALCARAPAGASGSARTHCHPCIPADCSGRRRWRLRRRSASREQQVPPRAREDWRLRLDRQQGAAGASIRSQAARAVRAAAWARRQASRPASSISDVL
jgi:hypothetical protein